MLRSLTLSSLYAGISPEIPDHPPSGSSASFRSSSTRNMRPPAIHSAAVHTGYSATNISSASATVRKPLLLSTSRDVHPREHEHRNDEGGPRDGEPERDRGALIECPRGDEERGEPQDRT